MPRPPARGSKRLQLLENQFEQLRVPNKLPQTLPPLFANIVSNRREAAAISFRRRERLDRPAKALPKSAAPVTCVMTETRGGPMQRLTLDPNCLAGPDERGPVQGAVGMLIEAARCGEADLAMLASSAFEHQPGGGHLNRLADFQKRLIAIGLDDITLLKPIARHGLSFHGFGIMSDESAVFRERLIFKTLFPTMPLRWTDFAVINGLDPKDLHSPGAWKWRNCLGAAQAYWSHENAKRDVFVTADASFWRLRMKAEFADAVIMTPTETVQMLADTAWTRLHLRGT